MTRPERRQFLQGHFAGAGVDGPTAEAVARTQQQLQSSRQQLLTAASRLAGLQDHGHFAGAGVEGPTAEVVARTQQQLQSAASRLARSSSQQMDLLTALQT